jgi:hypothetical protein
VASCSLSSHLGMCHLWGGGHTLRCIMMGLQCCLVIGFTAAVMPVDSGGNSNQGKTWHLRAALSGSHLPVLAIWPYLS